MDFKPDFRVIVYLFAAFAFCGFIVVASYLRIENSAENMPPVKLEKPPEKMEMFDI